MSYLIEIKNSISHRKSSKWLLLITTVITFSVVLIPDLNTITTEVLIGNTLLWIFCPDIFFIQVPKGLKTALISLTLLFGVILFYKIIGISTAWWDIQAGYFGCLICAWFSVFSLALFSKKQLNAMKWLIYVVSMVAMFYVSVQGLGNFQLMDIEEAISQEHAIYGSSLMIFSGISLIGFLNEHKIIPKLLYLSGVVMALYVTIVIMQRGTNTIMLIVLLAGIVLSKYIKRINLFKFTVLVGVVFIVFYYSGIISYILDFIIDNVSSERLAKRFIAIKFFLDHGDIVQAGSSLTSRAELIELSWHSFTSNLQTLLFGVGDMRGANSIVGNHSEIIDTLARYGLFGFSFLFVYFYKLIKWWYNELPFLSSLRYQVVFILLVYVARDIWGNALSSAISVYIFMYLPIVIYPYLKSNNNTISKY